MYEDITECLNENNGLIRDWGILKHSNDELNGKTVIVVENIAEAQSLLLPFHKQYDLILSYDSYVKCDDCQRIVDIEDTEIVDEEDLLCSSCRSA